MATQIHRLTSSIGRLSVDEDPAGREEIIELISLRRDVNRVVVAGDDKIVDYIISLVGDRGRTYSSTENLLSHFHSEIKDIVQDVLNTSRTAYDENIIREILDRCYEESCSGTLHSDAYYGPYDEKHFGWPYEPDPEWEAEAYYEHEDRLDLDENYAKRFKEECKRHCEQKSERQKEWVDAWVQALDRCTKYLTEPTLFCQLPTCPPLTMAIPRFLFRAFDEDSSGKTNERVVASSQNISGSGRNVDMFSLSDEDAAKMLYNHLKTKGCFGPGNIEDNLMSWSSSLLFVIQYAIWRRRQTGRSLDEIMICALDTTRIPKGQFARDKDLIRAYRQTANDIGDLEMQAFFDFRLTRVDYDNGEFLSQGKLYHSGRSCTFSLGNLIQAGLYNLYPEFGEQGEIASWTNQVKALRLEWSSVDPTKKEDVRTAIRIAKECFQGFNETLVALLILTFKPRMFKVVGYTVGIIEYFSEVEHLEPETDLLGMNQYGPREVQLYLAISRILTQIDPRSFENKMSSPSFARIILELVFECT